MTSIIPERTADPREAWDLVKRDGAAILRWEDLTEAGTTAAGYAFMGEHLRGIGQVHRVTSEPPKKIKAVPPTETLLAHTDGFAYGPRNPDYLTLHCIVQSPEGGESFLIDGYALLERMASDPNNTFTIAGQQANAAQWLHTEVVEQTEVSEKGFVMEERYFASIVQTRPNGRRWIRNHPYHRPHPQAPDPAGQQALIDFWMSTLRTEAAAVERFKLYPGDALFVDNYRVLHGRDPYLAKSVGEMPNGRLCQRILHRLWMWSPDAAGIPEGIQYSDPDDVLVAAH